MFVRGQTIFAPSFIFIIIILFLYFVMNGVNIMRKKIK